MTADEWADAAIGGWGPWLDPRLVGPAVEEAEVWALIRAVYVDGYLDGLSGTAAPPDPCAAAERLLLLIPV